MPPGMQTVSLIHAEQPGVILSPNPISHKSFWKEKAAQVDVDRPYWDQMILRCRTLVSAIVALHAICCNAADRSAFLERHCYECHDSESKKGGLDLTLLKLQPDQPSNFNAWVKVHDALSKGAMPPAKKLRPDAQALNETVASLADELTATDEARQKREGRTGVRRLSRVEFENTLRDLLAVPGLRVLHNLPADGKSHGFDRSAEALDFSYVHLAEHLGAVDAALDSATPAFAEKPPVFTYRWYPWQSTVIRMLTQHKEAIGLAGLTRDESFTVEPSGIVDAEPKSNAIGLFRLGDADAVAQGVVANFGGRLLNADGKPVNDATIELWQADHQGRYAHPADGRQVASNSFRGFGRCATSKQGTFAFSTIRPGQVPGPGGKLQAPHINVGILARGLLKRLFTRIYFAGDPANAADPILALVPADRRDTLMARPDPADPTLYRLDIRLQGKDETVFFEA